MEKDDVQLIRAVLDGDNAAFNILVQKHQKGIHALVWRKIGDFHYAEEITQDTFLRAYENLSTLKNPNQFTGWLYVIANRLCIAWLRKKKPAMQSLEGMSVKELEKLAYARYISDVSEQRDVEITAYRYKLAKKLLEKLPDSERTVMTLYYLGEMTTKEIGKFLGVSVNTITSRLQRARKRLQKDQELLVQEILGGVQIPTNLSENIMREIADMKPTPPPVVKPFFPWMAAAAAVLVLFLLGTSNRYLTRFQKPYSFEAQSEMTVELVDTSIVRELARKSDALTRFGKADVPAENSGFGFQSEPLLIAAAQADEAGIPTAKPQWIQTKGPGGVSNAGLFLASDQTLYAIVKTGLYRLTETAETWALVSASGPNREFNRIMAEQDGTLYLLTPDELLVSIDNGKTWHSLGAKPQGRTVALITTDTAMYLVLTTEVFRSKDVGKQWESIQKGLQTVPPEAGVPDFYISGALAIDNTLFLGTSQGLFRFTDNWEKLPVPTSQGINSLAAAKDRIYVGTTAGLPNTPDWVPHAAIFYSTNLGNSWTNITPDPGQHSAKTIASIEVVPIKGTLMSVSAVGVLLSYDGGETWIDPGRDRNASGASRIVALDENNFYKTDYDGITRSMDGGFTWQPFTTGLINSSILSLTLVENVLYALTYTEMHKSTDGGESWKSVGSNTDENTPLKGTNVRVVAADGVLYASNSKLDGVTLFRLSDAADAFLRVEGVPDFEEDTSYTERSKKGREAIENGVDITKVTEILSADQDRIMEELKTNGTFTVVDDTFFMEYKHKLFRWRHGETAWHYTGLEDHEGISPIYRKGFTLAVSGKTVYAGKREGDLFLSLDNGDTWRNITENLAFSFDYFKEILFVGSTIYVSTNMGVMSSRDGEIWQILTNTDGKSLSMDWITVDGAAVYGVCDSGVYQVDIPTNTWKRIISELPYTATSLAIDSDTLYIGTKQNGVFRFQREDP